MWPDAILRFLADIGTAATEAFDRDTGALNDYQIGITVTSHGDHVATLYEEGWDFTEPTQDGAR